MVKATKLPGGLPGGLAGGKSGGMSGGMTGTAEPAGEEKKDPAASGMAADGMAAGPPETADAPAALVCARCGGRKLPQRSGSYSTARGITRYRQCEGCRDVMKTFQPHQGPACGRESRVG